VQADYNSAPGTNWALLIVGRVPVPYSGLINPDGHPDHYGAWPTDAYYADVNGTWTDTSANNSATAINDLRNRNVPGDGKFDQSTLPSVVELQAGRVDLSNMPNAPTSVSETTLLRQYLARDHQFRRGLAPYASVQRRTLIDDNFGYFSGEAFAASGYRNAIGFFGRNAGQVDALDWFGTLGTTPFLLAYGCGGGSPTSANGIGSTSTEFALNDSKAVFCMLFGSWFGDWDATNNFLRAPLCGTQDSLGLADVWSGRAYYHLYHMALGEVIGYSSRYTANNSEDTFFGGWGRDGFVRSIHYGLVGDPTLRLHTVLPTVNVSAVSTAGGVVLTWQASADATLGYHVFAATSAAGPFTRLTGGATSTADPAGSPLPSGTLTYTHAAAVAATTYTYLVKAVKMETSASGSYVNTSVGEMIQITHQSPAPVPAAPTGLIVTGTANVTYTLAWQDHATDETGYVVERRNPATGVWSEIATLPADATGYVDSAATAAQINHYRVHAVNANGSSPNTPETAAYNLPGIAACRNDFQATTVSAGNIAIPFRRYSGSQGSVSATYSITPILGTPGVDFSATGGSAAWGHGVTGDSTANVSILQPPGPQLTKIFRLNLSGSTGGLGLGSSVTTWVQISDPSSQTLPSPWLATAVNNGNITDGYAEHVSGTFGAMVRGGGIGWVGDGCRFIYRPVNGDCRLTARVPAYSTLTNGGNWGVMIRESTDSNSKMNSILFRGDNTSAVRIGRASTAADANGTSAYSSDPLPANSWLRVSRIGNTIATEYSLNGTTWTAVGTPITLSSPVGNSLLAGLAVASNQNGLPQVFRAYARFDNVEVIDTPAAPAGFAAVPTTQAGEAAVSWTASAGATEYRLERSTQSGTGFVQIATVSGASYTDSGLTGQTYYYRVRAANSLYASAYSSEVSTIPLLTPIEAWRLAAFGTASNTGPAADGADPDLDGLKNLVEYVLGLAPNTPSISGQPVIGRYNDGTQDFLTLTFARKLSATGVTLKIEVGDSISNLTSILDPLLPANQTSKLDSVPAAGWQTLTIKDAVPMQGQMRFMRLRVDRP
jgi:regulation of enolase protein 1 (concanavalin A-like superfamily)